MANTKPGGAPPSAIDQRKTSRREAGAGAAIAFAKRRADKIRREFEEKQARTWWVLLKMKRPQNQAARLAGDVEVPHMQWSEVTNADRDQLRAWCSSGNGWCVFLPQGESPDKLTKNDEKSIYSAASKRLEAAEQARTAAAKRQAEKWKEQAALARAKKTAHLRPGQAVLDLDLTEKPKPAKKKKDQAPDPVAPVESAKE